MLVDDAVVVRGLFARWVEAEPDLEVVASLRTGREAVAQIERADPDVAVLDVDMPELDGIAALPLLLAKKRDLVVIMASTLTRRNAEISLKALSLGATDYIPKPTANREVTGATDFRRDLIEKIRQLGLRSKRLRLARRAPQRRCRPSLRRRCNRHCRLDESAHAPLVLRAMPATAPRVLLIGSSTGGPQALNAIVGQIGSVLERAPVLITQHMPPTFTTILAEHLARVAKCPVREAQGRRGDQCRHHLSGARRQAHDGQAPRRRRGDRDRRRPAGELLQARRSTRCLPPPPRCGATRCWRWCSPAWAPTA